jgi:hypothetical protein
MARRIERGKICGCVAYPGFGAISMMSLCGIAFAAVAAHAQIKGDYLHVFHPGSLTAAMVVSLVAGPIVEVLLPLPAMVWGVGVACPIFLGAGVISLAHKSACPNALAVAAVVLDKVAPPPVAPSISASEENQCVAMAAGVGGMCFALGVIAAVWQLCFYYRVVQCRISEARMADAVEEALLLDTTPLAIGSTYGSMSPDRDRAHFSGGYRHAAYPIQNGEV